MASRVLVVDDDGAMCELLEESLAREFEVRTARGGSEAVASLDAFEPDVVLTDLQMRGIGGVELCARLKELRPDVPVVVMTAFGSIEIAVSALRAGADDFVTKPFQLEAIAHSIRRAARHRALHLEVGRLRTERLRAGEGMGAIVGASAAIRRVIDLVGRVAASEASVLVTGESGTGKELVARALHDASPRAEGPFVALNCAAMPESLLESELFGHKKGSFTDAKADRVGLFLRATRGTIFLDEVADLPHGLQPKLLRALQERRIRPVGGDDEIAFDARVVAATNRDLERDVAEGRFREDLYYRLNVIEIALPPLRVRGNDVLALAQSFLDKASASARKEVAGLTPEVAERLLAYPWPGNVRELQNVMERAVALTRYDRVTVEDLPDRVKEHRGNPPPPEGGDAGDFVPLEEIERRYILRVFEAVEGNKSVAAQILGVDRKTLYRRLEQYGAIRSRRDAGG